NWCTEMRRLALWLVLAGCRPSAPSSASPAATVEPTRIAVVNGEEIRALVPPQLRADPAAYQSFARQFVYRAALRQRARAQDVALTAAERAGVDATLPPLKAVQDMLRRQGMSYDSYRQEAYDVALVQKMERREVFDRVTV